MSEDEDMYSDYGSDLDMVDGTQGSESGMSLPTLVRLCSLSKMYD